MSQKNQCEQGPKYGMIVMAFALLSVTGLVVCALPATASPTPKVQDNDKDGICPAGMTLLLTAYSPYDLQKKDHNGDGFVCV